MKVFYYLFRTKDYEKIKKFFNIMRQYNFLKDDWNGSPKTVWSRKKQNKLFKLLIKKYPTAKDLRKKLFQINTEDSIKLGNYINPKWDYEQYYRFIT